MLIRKNYQRTFLAVLLSGMALNAYAVAPGFYMGLMAGPATNNASEKLVPTASGTPATTLAKPQSQQFATRIYMGNKINQYVAAEFGMTYFSNINYTSNQPAAGGLVSRVRDFDLVAKLSMPLGNQFDIFGKAGAAYAYTTSSGGLTQTGKTQYQDKIAPTVSLGASYDLNQNWVMDLSANSVIVGGQISRASYLALGISYHFVNKYCGQFLCDDE